MSSKQTTKTKRAHGGCSVAAAGCVSLTFIDEGHGRYSNEHISTAAAERHRAFDRAVHSVGYTEAVVLIADKLLVFETKVFA